MILGPLVGMVSLLQKKQFISKDFIYGGVLEYTVLTAISFSSALP
jgi:hypothetical protein